MKYVDISNIKFRHIQIFLAVAEYGNFTIASEKLHLTQPFVSKTIASLEHDLGLYLFIRGNRKFQITPAGRKLYQEWNSLTSSFENSISSAHMLQTGRTDTLQIGIGELGHKVNNNILLENLKRTKQLIPDLDIYVAYNTMSSLIRMLLKNEMDLIVVSKHMLPEISNLDICWKMLVPSYLSVYIHTDNPLSKLNHLQFCDLRCEEFIIFSPEIDNNYFHLLQNLAHNAGFHPMISYYVKNENSFWVNLELNNGIVLADSLSNLANDHIRQFNLPERNDLIAMWKPENMRESLQTFLNLFPND